MKTNDPSRLRKLNQPELKVYSSLELPIHTKQIDLTKPTCVQSRQSIIHTDDRRRQAINLTYRPKHNVLRQPLVYICGVVLLVVGLDEGSTGECWVA